MIHSDKAEMVTWCPSVGGGQHSESGVLTNQGHCRNEDEASDAY